MRTAIVMPRNMHFCQSRATSIDLCAHDLALHSQNKSNLRIFAGGEEDLFEDVDVFAVTEPGRKPTPAKFYDPLSEFGPQLIVVHQHLETAFQIITDFPGTPVILHRHGRFERNSAFKRWKYTRKMNRLAGIIWVGEDARNNFCENFTGVKARSVVVPNGIDCELWSPAPKENSVIYVGRAREDKGVFDLAQAWLACADRLDRTGWKLNLVLAVTDEGEQSTANSLRQMLSSHADSVSIETNLNASDVQKRLARSSIAVVPSIVAEGFGRTAIEAMSCGAAVITTHSGGLWEAVGETGKVINPRAPKEIASALLDLADNRPLREEMAEAGRERVLRLFNIQQIAENYDDMLMSLWDDFVSGSDNTQGLIDHMLVSE
ncbi:MULTISPECIES: glycosyltransferase family 4 protein [unclassified Pseudovibrio]|uniref:glycosyltransferase family 4 protein n=1 Tax=unclassified Pseudovibrio TaxID=2627060 RepID=UPI001AD94ABC|nr:MULTISPECIES: glycosyltransferase family 4 protein [unclassified Pseudovibrio]